MSALWNLDEIHRQQKLTEYQRPVSKFIYYIPWLCKNKKLHLKKVFLCHPSSFIWKVTQPVLHSEFSFIDFIAKIAIAGDKEIFNSIQGAIFSFSLQSIGVTFCRSAHAHASRHPEQSPGVVTRDNGGGNGFELRERLLRQLPPWRLNLFSSLAETRTSELVVTVSGMDPGTNRPIHSTTYFNNRHTDAAAIIVASRWSRRTARARDAYIISRIRKTLALFSADR